MDPVTLCNAALARLGEARIVDLLDDNVAARACHAMLPIARAEVLRSHRWNFATARATLAALGEAPAFGYARAYGLPADNLRVLEVNGVSGTGGPGAAWEVEGEHLLCQDETCHLVYVRDEDNYHRWDPLAQAALILLLASRIAPAIMGGSTHRAQELREEYDRLIAPIARRIDANESRRAGGNAMDQLLTGSHALQARRCGV